MGGIIIEPIIYQGGEGIRLESNPPSLPFLLSNLTNIYFYGEWFAGGTKMDISDDPSYIIEVYDKTEKKWKTYSENDASLQIWGGCPNLFFSFEDSERVIETTPKIKNYERKRICKITKAIIKEYWDIQDDL